MRHFSIALLFSFFAVSLTGGNIDGLFAAGKTGEIRIPAGEHMLAGTVEVTEDLHVILAHGAVIRSGASPMFRVSTGKLILEGEGGGGTIRCLAKFGGMTSPERCAVIDLNRSLKDSGKTPAALCVRNITFQASYGIDGALRGAVSKKIGEIEIGNCRFFCSFRGIGIFDAEVESCRITDSLFDGGQDGIYINASVPGGVYVCGNTVRNFGKNGIVLGKGGQIAEGITAHLPCAVVHDNRLLHGGFAATTQDAYIRGIVVIGHNVSVQGNIVRDVHRGVPVPGRKSGHQIVENGQVFKERMRDENGRKVRLAGSAIYLKANRAVVHSNICTNSGWRSVIEIKTGGREHYTSVVNNVVDASSLAADDSFAFECNSGRSLWANNIVYNVPHQAFIVRCGYENTFVNNLIVDAKVGFALSGNARGEGELISGNRFINVLCPVSLNGAVPKSAAGADIHRMPQSYIHPETELPPPSEENAGRMIVRGQSLFCCVRTESGFSWMELAGKIVPEKKWVPAGPELAVNADQSGTGDIPAGLNDPLHPGWLLDMMSAREVKLLPSDGHVSFDRKNFLSGGRSLKILFKNTTGSFRLRQPVDLVPGKRYRATAVVRSEEAGNLSLSVRSAKGFSKSVRAADSGEWQTLSCDFAVGRGDTRWDLIVSGAKTPENKAAWLDSVSLRELQEESLFLRSRKKETGPDLIDRNGPWTVTPRGRDLRCESKDGVLTVSSESRPQNVIVSRKIKIQPGKSCRVSFDCRADGRIRVSAFVRIGTKRIAKDFEASGKWETHRFELTAPKEGAPGAIGFWTEKLGPGKTIRFRNISCRELEK